MVVTSEALRAEPVGRIVSIVAVRCSGCGTDLTAEGFSDGMTLDYPVYCTKQLVRAPLWHAPERGGCGGTLILSQEITEG